MGVTKADDKYQECCRNQTGRRLLRCGQAFRKVTFKTLVMHAANDGVHPIGQGRELAANNPDCEFVLLESANHAILPEEPAWDRLFWELEHFDPQ